MQFVEKSDAKLWMISKAVCVYGWGPRDDVASNRLRSSGDELG